MRQRQRRPARPQRQAQRGRRFHRFELEGQPRERCVAGGAPPGRVDGGADALARRRGQVLPHDRVHQHGGAAGAWLGELTLDPLGGIAALHAQAVVARHGQRRLQALEALALLGPHIRLQAQALLG